uniref:Uncharacterized protein n=1 Tax=Bicosoecida sp. CB-2014 TaxID=1486930 RepID=A0A7S1CE55_9STRA
MAATSRVFVVAVVAALLHGAVAGKTKIEFRLTFDSIPDKSINHATAYPQVQTTTIDASGVGYDVTNDVGGEQAKWTSFLVKQQGNHWSEAGNITFGSSGAGINFESFGLSGQVKNGPATGASYGAITYNISGGYGAYKGADGVMVDMFESDGVSPSFPISAWGFFWIDA